MPGAGNTWQIDGEKTTAQQIANAPLCGGGNCLIIANLSPSDTLYFSSNRNLLETAKSAGEIVGIPLLAGEKIVIPWVTSAIYAINFNSGATPNDSISCETWE